MRAIGRELGVALAIATMTFAGFFVVLLTWALFLIYVVCCFVIGVLVLMGVMCGLGWFLTHRSHELWNAAGFLGEAALLVAVMAVLMHYKGRLVTWPERRRLRLQQQAALERMGALRLARAADTQFAPDIGAR